MATSHRIVNSLLLTGLVMVNSPATQANDQYGGMSPASQTNEQPQHRSAGDKALNGFANLFTAPLEIPKNIINTTNQSNIFYGVVGGMFKGMVNTGGRIGVGIADVLTIPIPTKAIAYPYYIWDDFDVDTSYGDVYRLNKSKVIPQPEPVVVAPPAPAPIMSAPAVAPRAPGYDQGQYGKDTNKKLDAVFKNKMSK